MTPRLLALTWLPILVSCGGPPRVEVLGKEEQPAPVHVSEVRRPGAEGSLELPSDGQVVEPDQPFLDTPGERALVHVHTPKDTCSGLVLGPRVVATARRCVGEGAVPPSSIFVEVPSSALTWTKRTVSRVVRSECPIDRLDVVALILAEPVSWVQPMRVVTSPVPGSRMQALGFGRCPGEGRSHDKRIGKILRREEDTVVVDLGLCHGDVGGALVEIGELDVAGIISHKALGVGESATAISRLDTGPARSVIRAARDIAEGRVNTAKGAAEEKPLPCNN